MELQVAELKQKIEDTLCPFGFEVYPFQVGLSLCGAGARCMIGLGAIGVKLESLLIFPELLWPHVHLTYGNMVSMGTLLKR